MALGRRHAATAATAAAPAWRSECTDRTWFKTLQPVLATTANLITARRLPCKLQQTRHSQTKPYGPPNHLPPPTHTLGQGQRALSALLCHQLLGGHHAGRLRGLHALRDARAVPGRRWSRRRRRRRRRPARLCHDPCARQTACVGVGWGPGTAAERPGRQRRHTHREQGRVLVGCLGGVRNN